MEVTQALDNASTRAFARLGRSDGSGQHVVRHDAATVHLDAAGDLFGVHGRSLLADGMK
jgi:hypothetical protein